MCACSEPESSENCIRSVGPALPATASGLLEAGRSHFYALDIVLLRAQLLVVRVFSESAAQGKLVLSLDDGPMDLKGGAALMNLACFGGSPNQLRLWVRNGPSNSTPVPYNLTIDALGTMILRPLAHDCERGDRS
jgi:hypothetical protein